MQPNELDLDLLAREWQYENTLSARVWLNRSLLLNVALVVLLVLTLATLVILVPLKERVPYVFSHNTTTGEITQLGELNHTDFSADWTLVRHFILQYVIARESYHSDNIDRPYQMAFALSAPDVARAYHQAVESSNPHAPLNRYRQDQFVTVDVKSIAKLNDNTVEVHFNKVIHTKNTGQTEVVPLATIVKWRFVNEPQTQTGLDRNPLGFKVTYYHPTPVTLTP